VPLLGAATTREYEPPIGLGERGESADVNITPSVVFRRAGSPDIGSATTAVAQMKAAIRRLIR